MSTTPIVQTNNIRIRAARSNEAESLSELAVRSKASWGYDDHVLTRFRATMRITSDDCRSGAVQVAVDESVAGSVEDLAGFYSVSGSPPVGHLSDLFMDPKWIGRGVGRLLVEAAMRHGRRLGFAVLDIHSDPFAEAFYLHLGATRTRSLSVGPGAVDVPILQLRLVDPVVPGSET